jgi:hypothetical protein
MLSDKPLSDKVTYKRFFVPSRLFVASGLLAALAVSSYRPPLGLANDDAAAATVALPNSASADTNSLSRAKQDATSALAAVAKLLESTDKANADAWRVWLEWDKLAELLAARVPDAAKVQQFEARLRQNERGLEIDQFRQLRDALRTLAVQSELAQSSLTDTTTELQRREVRALAAALGEQPLHSDADKCAQLLDWLSRLDDAGAKEAAAVRSQYSQPNVSARVSRRFAEHMAARVVEDSRPFTATAMGAQSSGTAITRINVGVEFVPDTNEGAIRLTLNGAVRMPDTVSTQRSVTVRSSADVAISAVKSVNVNHNGLRFDPASANATADIRIDDVSAEFQIIEWLARRRADRMRPEAANDTSRRVADEIENRADELSSELLTNAHKFFCEQIRSPLLRLDSLPERFQFSTTTDYLQIIALQRSFNQLAAAVPAPVYTERDDLAFRLHESFLNNVAASLLPGKTVQDRHWLEILGLITGSKPRGLWVHDRADPWSVTFARELPISTRIADGHIHVTLRFNAARVGDQTWQTPIRVEATLKPRITREGPALFRDGDVAIHIDNTTTNDKLHRTLSRKFDAVFPEELHFDGLVAPEGGALGKLNALELADLRCERGWFSLGYHLNSTAPSKSPSDQSSSEVTVAGSSGATQR